MSGMLTYFQLVVVEKFCAVYCVEHSSNVRVRSSNSEPCLYIQISFIGHSLLIIYVMLSDVKLAT